MSLITFTPFSYSGSSADVGASTVYITTSDTFDDWREYSNKIASDLDSLSDSVNSINGKFESGVASGELLVWDGSKWDNGNLPATAISGLTALDAPGAASNALEGNDELLVHNGGTLQKVTVENLQKFISPEAITDQTDLSAVATDDSILIYDNDAAALAKTTVSALLAGAGTGSMSSFALQDGDGSEVSITDGKEIKFIEGDGIDINWTSESDPYELTFSLDAGVSAGNGLTGSGTFKGGTYTISHPAAAASASSSTNTGRTYIQNIELDSYGHITNISSAEETAPLTYTDTNKLTTFVLEDEDSGEVTIAHDKEVKFIGDGINTKWTDTSHGTDADPYTLTFTNADKGSSQNIFKNVQLLGSTAITSWSDSGTVSSNSNNDTLKLIEGNGIELKVDTDSKTFRIAHEPVSAAEDVDNSGGTVIQDLTFDTLGHVTATGSYNLDDRYYTETETNNTFIKLTTDQTVNGIKTFAEGLVNKDSVKIHSDGWPQLILANDNGEDERFGIWRSGDSDIMQIGPQDTTGSGTSAIQINRNGSIVVPYGGYVGGPLTFNGGTVKIENYGSGSDTFGGNVILERPHTTNLGGDIFLGLASNDSLAVYETTDSATGSTRGATLDITKCITGASSSIIVSNDATVTAEGIEDPGGATIQKMVKIGQADYDALSEPDGNTLYIIVGA